MTALGISKLRQLVLGKRPLQAQFLQHLTERLRNLSLIAHQPSRVADKHRLVCIQLYALHFNLWFCKECETEGREMTGLENYNGYSGAERLDKFKEMNRLLAVGGLPKPIGACDLCGDSGVELEYHDEDYSIPYLWTKPAAYMVCHHCHVQKIHARFRFPHRWKAFLAHVRRGGYASDLYGEDVSPELTREFEACCEAFKTGQPRTLKRLRNYRGDVGQEWFAQLSVAEISRSAPASRPRP